MIIIKKRKLSNSKLYTSGVYNNPYYKFLEPETRKINSHNVNLGYISSEVMNNTYQCIIRVRNFYILSKDGIINKLYKVSNNYKEVEEIELKIPKEYIDEIKCLFYDGRNKKIIITTSKNVYSVNLNGYFIKEEANKDLLNKRKAYQAQMMKDLNGYYFQVEKMLEIDSHYFTCCGLFFNQKFVGICKNGSAYLLEISELGNPIEEYFIDDNIKINSLIVKDNHLELLVTKDNKYNYIYKTNKTYNQTKYNRKKGEKYYESDIISSILLMESSLVNIINIEREKLQKCLASSNDIDEILEVSHSLNKTIKNITSLEKNLYNMLVTATKEDKNIKKKIK